MDAGVGGRPWLAMAVLAVVSLGATVFVAQRALSDATEILVRGEGDLLMSAVTSDLLEDGPAPPGPAQLEHVFAQRSASGLRYIGLLQRDGHAIAEAGTAEIRSVVPRPGQSTVVGHRVRVSAPLGPPRRGDRSMMNGPMGLLVVEFEPPTIEVLRRDLARIAIVAAGAGVVLLAFAVAWSRSAARLASIERRAEREQRLVALGTMSSVMAHEIRNPLASLKGHAQLLAEELEEPKKRARAERVVAEAERLELLTTNLLDFIREGPIERTELSPAELVARSLDDLPKERVDVDLDAAPKMVRVDPLRLSRAVHNLVDNALQATPEGERVELQIRREGRNAVIEVRDRGQGIPAEAAAQIFEPFFTTRTRGTGLGLAIARRIAERHDGTLTGDNRDGGGAVFRIHFPHEDS